MTQPSQGPTDSANEPAAQPEDRLALRPGTTVAAASLLMAGMILLSRFTGIARDVVISHLFGQTAETSCYVSAFNIPDFIYFLISGGALATGFVPVFTEYLSEDRREAARRTFRAMMTLLAVCVLVAIGLCMAFTPQLIYAAFPGYRDQPEMLALTTALTRIILPAQFFFVLGGLFAGTLHTLRYFFVPALQPLLYNAGIIVGGAVLGPTMGVAGLSWGALIGAAVGCFAFQIPLLLRKGISFRPLWDVRDPGVRKVVSLVLPIILGLSISQITAILLPRSLASTLGDKITTAVQNANRLMQMPVAMFASSIAIALLPSMSMLAAKRQFGELRQGLSVAFRAVLLLTFPSAILLAVLRVPVIDLLFEHGKFGPQDTQLVARTLLFYLPAVPAMGTQQVVSRGFYALQDTRTPVVIGLGAIAVFFVAAHFLVGPWEHGGLALSSAIAALVNAIALLLALGRKLGGLEGRRCWSSGVCCFIAAGGCGGAAYATQRLLRRLMEDVSLAQETAHVLAPLAIGILAYALLLVAFRVPEAKLVGERIQKRLRPS